MLNFVDPFFPFSYNRGIKEGNLAVKQGKSLPIKKYGKQDREKKVLLGLVEYYILTGKPVGSNTLKETGFEDLSSATIRNYFARLEEEGFLSQQHASGGRIPTAAAFRFYANEYIDSTQIDEETEKALNTFKNAETPEVVYFLQKAVEKLSSLTSTAVFLTSPRFDHDFILDIKFVALDHHRCLCIVITNFGVIQTELLQVETKLSSFAAKRIEGYFHWRLTGHDKPENLEKEEEDFAQNLYNELMVRYIVGYSNFSNEEIYRTGFSRLLAFPDFNNGMTLATSLGLFENSHTIRLLARECMKMDRLKVWIGNDLDTYSPETPNCTIIAIPYYINRKVVGSIGMLSPMRIPYKHYFATLRYFSDIISESLTKNLYKFKITFREPSDQTIYLQKEEQQLIGESRYMLLEDHRT